MATLRGRQNFIAIMVFLALLVIFLPLFFQDYRADSFQSFIIPSLPSQPSTELFFMRSSKHGLQNLWSFPLPPAKAWVAELPDFKGKADADAWVQTLRDKNFKAYSQSSRLTDNSTRVFVGPDINLEQMKQEVDQLNAEMNLQAKLVPFDPLLVG